MMGKKGILIVYLLAVSIGIHAQNKEYKKIIFPLLEAKDYSKGGPLLKSYINDPKHGVEASPHYMFAIILEKEFSKQDIVLDSSRLFSVGDSAASFFLLAKKFIDEKELKSNDEYWQPFNRRNLRTGEFGIKVSDVHLDIEKKVKAINNKVELVHQLNKNYFSLVEQNNKCQKIYEELIDEYANYHQFLLRISKDDIQLLDELIEESAKISRITEKITSNISALENDTYVKEIINKEIKDFGSNVEVTLNGIGEKIELWDYESWARDSKVEINGSVALFKSAVANYGREIKGQNRKLKAGIKLKFLSIPEEITTQFDKYEPNSEILKLLELETSESLIIGKTDILRNPVLQDSSLIGAHYDIYENGYQIAKKISDLAESIDMVKIDSYRYLFPGYLKTFYKQYGTATNYLIEKKKWALRKKIWNQEAMEYWEERNRWGIHQEDFDIDSIALFDNSMLDSMKYTTLKVGEFNNERAIVFGLNQFDSLAFVGSFGVDRKTEWIVSLPTPSANKNTLILDTFPVSDGGYGVYLFDKSYSYLNKPNFSIGSISEDGELLWKTTLKLDNPPVDFQIDPNKKELTVYLVPIEEVDMVENGFVIINSKGNVK